ncbi:1-aminocyclopropane-1-carboxylate oxidase homolog 11-like [Sesamum indicum]|uniref:1-aminocyclopropane-1-carboxylate oxidase homolog 11-like n=1 Tax=Sesamum indicum TaxID=4182 RepID=A0A8M8V2W8_SESIN|nr:1-aminocyclopropane-1-carboxylate oxidase homolog 11-like [Sesamum indicum]
MFDQKLKPFFTTTTYNTSRQGRKPSGQDYSMATDDYDWEKEVEEFEKTKAGVKGLVDSGITKVPRFFIRPLEKLPGRANSRDGLHVQIPVIDFQGVEGNGTQRRQIVDEIRKASETWGFFQIVNHGVPTSVTDGILESTRRFHEQPKEAKMDLYSSDGRRNVRFYTVNGHLKKPEVAAWRDAFSCTFMDDVLDPKLIPPVCRNEITEYMNQMINVRDVLSELLSEALGLSRDFLERLQCMKSEYLSCLYYPPCPEPDRTLGTVKHSDPTILTVLVQDDSGGLQIHHHDDWLDVPPVQGALIINIGDFLQLITNDKFKSVEHRVLARSKGTRVSAACFFYPSSEQIMKAYGPIQELLSEENPALYREVSYIDFLTHYQKNVRGGHSALSNFKVIHP